MKPLAVSGGCCGARTAPAAAALSVPDKIRTEMHYTAHEFFLDEGYILKHTAKLTMPIYLVTGRYDMVTPSQTAYSLDEALPNSQLIWTINGHLRQHEARNIQRLLLDQLMKEV